MKIITSFLVTGLGILVSDASAATYYVDFGNNSLTSAGLYLMNGAADANTPTTAQLITNLSIGSSGLSMSSSAVVNGTGKGGTFVGGGGTNGVGSGMLSGARPDWFVSSGYETSCDKGWQDLASGGNNWDNTLTFSGLQASTTYTFTILSLRANDGMTGTGQWSVGFSEGASGITGQSFSGKNWAGSDLSGSFDSTVSVDSGAGKGGQLIYTFTTGDVAPDSFNLNLSGNWNLNMIQIDAMQIPEPAVASLGLLGVALLGVRRRRA